MLYITFTGTQKGMTNRQKETLRQTLKLFKSRHIIFIHGDCIGADKEANDIAKSMHIRRYIYPSNIKLKRAFCMYADFTAPPDDPLTRNHKMVKKGNILFAAPKTSKEELRSGTWATIRYARKLHRPIIIAKP